MKTGICMRLKCVECGIWHEIPNDKIDNFNIYYKAQPTLDNGLDISYAPSLLCPPCTKKYNRRYAQSSAQA